MIDPLELDNKELKSLTPQKFSYNIDDYGWQALIQNAFKIENLNRLHELRSDLLPLDTLEIDTESKTLYHQTFYAKMNAGWDELSNTYHSFIATEISPFFKNDFLYQYMPTFRVHLPNDQAIHGWHCDTEPGYDHPFGEINIQLAITEMQDTSATWVESSPGRGDFRPMNMKYGEFTIFNGNTAVHGNKVNLTAKTRVSLDFRILPLHKYKGPGKTTATARKTFAKGDYYSLYEQNIPIGGGFRGE